MTNDMDSRFSQLEIDDVPAPKKPAAPAPTPAPKPAPLPELPKLTTALPAPADMKTPQGVQMSPRASRVYHYLNTQGIRLTPFSTDSCVAGYKAKIEAARDALATPPTGFTNHPTTIDVITDINAILTRVPQNRVAPTGYAAAQQAVQSSVVDAQAGTSSLVALSLEGQTTGAVTYWRLSGEVNVDELRAAWEAQGLDLNMLVSTPSEAVALHRAVKEQATKHRMVRQHPEGGWQIIDEKHVKDAAGKSLELSYEQGVRVYLNRNATGAFELRAAKASLDRLSEAKKEEAMTMLRAIRAEYDRALTQVASIDVSTWLVRLTSRVLKGVALRDTGGLYFVPKHEVATLKKVKAALKAASAHVVYEIPAMHSEEAIVAVLDALRHEASEGMTEIENEIAQNDGTLSSRAIKGRLAYLDDLASKITGYEKLLGAARVKDLADKTKALRDKVSKMASRGSLLEVD